jgi:hypothetical protein
VESYPNSKAKKINVQQFALFLIPSQAETKKEKFLGTISEMKTPSQRSGSQCQEVRDTRAEA